ncbi:MAG: DoxX family membrane protein [Phycisphaerales bacterium]
MNFRQRVGLAWGPLPLRLGLAIAFIWAGAGKIFETAALTSSQAGTLASMGVSLPVASPVETPVAPPSEKAPPASAPKPEEPGDAPPKPNGPDAPLPAPDGTKDPAADPERATKAKRSGSGGGAAREAPAKSADRSRKSQATLERVRHDVPVEGMVDLEPPRVAARTQETPVAGSGAGSGGGGGSGGEAKVYPDGLRVRSVYKLALLLRSASEPPRIASESAAAPASAPGPLWPARLAQERLPVYFAWSVALTELLGGVLVLAGLFTRLTALGFAGVMVGAIWLTQIGPAVQSGKATLGVLPSHGTFDVAAWMPLQWQVALLCMSAALLFVGPGAAALDNIMWSSSGDRKKPGPAAAPKQA